MLAEIAAANAAFAVIKGALANGKELHQLGSRVFDYFDNKAKIQESANKKGGGSDLDNSFASLNIMPEFDFRLTWHTSEIARASSNRSFRFTCLRCVFASNASITALAIASPTSGGHKTLYFSSTLLTASLIALLSVCI